MGSKFSLSHQVGMNCVPQIDAGSNLVSVLGLKPLGKRHRIHQGQPPPLSLHRLLWWNEVLKSHQSETRVIIPKQTNILLCSVRQMKEKLPLP